MRNQEIIDTFNKRHFKTAAEVKQAGLKIKKLGSGAFRTAYLVENKLVAKFPTGNDRYCKSGWGHTAITHSVIEVATINKILKKKKYKPLHRYMPDILYFNAVTGVILMYRYDRTDTRIGSIVCNMLHDLARDIGLSFNDLHEYNVGINDFDEVKILDMGLGT